MTTVSKDFIVKNGISVGANSTINGTLTATAFSGDGSGLTNTPSSPLAINNAASASLYANTGINNAASASLYANTGINNAASASLYANTGINNAASASLYANTGINNAASASAYANTGINNAASASAYANTKVSKSGDTITGPIIITDTTSGALQVSGTVTIGKDLNVTGNVVSPTLTSTVAIGTAPFVVTSTTPVTNLNIGGNAATATNVAWSGVTSKPTTRAGYGITDAANNAAPLDAVTSSGTIAATSYTGGGLPVMVNSAAASAAMMSFHRPGVFGASIGIDTDNVWKVGGWSMGANSYPIYHAGNPQVNIGGNAATATNVAWSGVTSKPTTRAGYGITDAANKAAPLDAVTSSGTIAASAGLPVMVYSADASAAMMSFHRNGVFGASIGIDTDNVWKVGGWSMGANSYPIYHAGNPQVNISGNAATATSSSGCNGAFTIYGGGYSDLYMQDTDEGTRRMHCNSNRIGFLNDSNGWGSYCGDGGEWYSDQSVRAPLFYDSNHTGYYLDPLGTSQCSRINCNDIFYANGSWSWLTGIYDTNNSGYYLDMDGTSRLATVNANSITAYSVVSISCAGINYPGTSSWNGKGNNSIGLTWGSASIWGSVDNVNNIILGTASDYRIKTNVVDLNSTLALIQKIRPITYDSLEMDGSLSGSSHAGVLAHELSEIIPNLVEGEKDAVNEEGKPIYQSVYYAGFAPYLIKAIQEQQEIITTQQQSINTLTDLITNLTNRISALENK